MLRHVPFLVAVLLVVVSHPLAASKANDDGPNHESAQSPALDLSTYHGKVVYVDFWASWCGPCKQSFPWMMALNDSLSADGLVLLTVNVDHERKSADAFLERMESKLPVIYDPQGQIAAAYELETMPSSFVYGRDGRLRAQHNGFYADKTEAIEAELRALLSEKGTDEAED